MILFEERMDTEFYFTFAEPFVCTAIHHGHKISPDLKDNLEISDAVRLREEDPRTEFFTRISSNRIIQHKSRFEYDLNRSRDKAFYLNPEDCWGLRARKTKPPADLIAKSLQSYDQFYRWTEVFLSELLVSFSHFFVYDIHSYNHHRLGVDQPFDDQEKNPEIIIGTNNMPEIWFPLVEKIRDCLRTYNFLGRKLDVRINVKFPGGHFSRWIHNTFPEKACCIAIEFKKIFMDEWSGKFYPEVMQELRKALKSTKPVILDYLNKK